jgi:hypothetical protein
VIDLTQRMIDANGAPSTNPKDGSPVLLREMLVSALLETPMGVSLSDTEKARRYEIFKRIRDAGNSISLRDDELAFLKEAVGAIFTPLARGEVLEMLEGRFIAPAAPRPGALAARLN